MADSSMSGQGNIYANLPRILEILAIDDAGEFGAATCPHCGAQGRYVVHFRCDDGTQRAAMRGCLRRFPMHPLAQEMARVLEKERTATKQGRQLASWDVQIRDAIRAFAAQELTEDEAYARVRQAQQRKAAWMRRQKW